MESRAREAAAHSAPQGGLLRSLRTLLADLLATLRTRGELLQVEIEQEKLRVCAVAIFALAAAFFLGLAVVLLSIFLMVLFWDNHRILVAGLLGLAYAVIGVCCAITVRRRWRVQSKMFSTSLAELDKDAARLSQP